MLSASHRCLGPLSASRRLSWSLVVAANAGGSQGSDSFVAVCFRAHLKVGLSPKRNFSCSSSCWSSNTFYQVESSREETFRNRRSHVENLLSRKWLAEEPHTRLSKILLSSAMETWEHGGSGCLIQDPRVLAEHYPTCETKDISPSFYVIRDDLLHPVLGGNKLRKLDALIPLLEDLEATDVVTCGGSQSAHIAALASACAERRIRCHLLLRGERPSVPTGYNLISSMYGYNTYVPRSDYANRTAMFMKYSSELAGPSGDVIWLDEPAAELKVGQSLEKRVVVVREGAGDAVALLGLIRLVEYLSRQSVFGSDEPMHIVVDSGTGTTAVGLALGIMLLELPWKITGIMLADSAEAYEAHKQRLVASFCASYAIQTDPLRLPLSWVERQRPRRFGKIFPDEIRRCQSVSRQTGILLDPIYTLAGWESASRLAVEAKRHGMSERVALLHTGGTLGLFGLAQRYAVEFY